MLKTYSGTQEFLIPLDEPYWFIKDQPKRAECHTHPMGLEVTQTRMQTPALLLTLCFWGNYLPSLRFIPMIFRIIFITHNKYNGALKAPGPK